MPRSQILRGLLREGLQSEEGARLAPGVPRSAEEGLAPLPKYPPGVEITGKAASMGTGDTGELGGGDPIQDAADQVRSGLQTLAAQYPDAQGLLQQFEQSMDQWMSGGAASPIEEAEEPLVEGV